MAYKYTIIIQFNHLTLQFDTLLSLGSHVKINEESLIKTVDRGSSQSLEDLNNTSNSSLSSGGFIIPATLNPPPPGRIGK